MAGRPVFKGGLMTTFGFERNVTGGIGGTPVVVSNLNDTGAGSLRDAVSASDRYITFDPSLAGYIDLISDKLRILQPNITIDARGSAIGLSSRGILVNSENVHVINMRVRPGEGAGATTDTDCLQTLDNADGVLFENCSCSWSVDEGLTITGSSNVVFYRCIMTSALYASVHPSGNHSMGMLTNSNINRPNNNSFYECLFTNNNSRNPLLVGNDGLNMTGNVIFYRNDAALLRENAAATQYIDLLGNIWIDTGQTTPDPELEGLTQAGNSELYMVDNRGPNYVSAQSDMVSAANNVFASAPLTPIHLPYRAPAGIDPVARLCSLVGARTPYLDDFDLFILEAALNRDNTVLNQLVNDTTSQIGGYPSLT